MTTGGAPDPAFLSRHYGIETISVEPFGEGLINRTFLLRSGNGSEYILQCVNPMFGSELHADIEAITAHVAGKGLRVPRLIRTRGGALSTRDDTGVWRLMQRLPGESRSVLQRPAEAESAGEMLAAFQSALLDLDHEFRSVRPGVHDTLRHLQHLRNTLERRADHPRFRRVEPLAMRILAATGKLPELPQLAPRIVHGDPKINNFLFEPGTDRVLCLVDLDTLSRMALPLELGDAFRSWCNPGGEDTPEVQFAPEMMLAGIRGYALRAAPWITAAEVRSIVPATFTICVELAARFCADALNEDFFAWNPKAFASHSEHSEMRAAGQFALSESLRGQMPVLERDVSGLFSSAGVRL